MGIFFRKLIGAKSATIVTLPVCLRIALNKLESEEIATKPTTEGVVVYNKLLVALQKTANKCLFEFVIPIAILKKEFSDNVAKMLIALMNR